MLHPIVGAIMLKEAFSLLRGRKDGSHDGLFTALEYTAERHTRSIGLTPKVVEACEVWRLDSYEDVDCLLLAGVEGLTEEFARYAHLVALADLINNVSERLNGTIEYRPVHAVPDTADQRVKYVKNGPDSGVFQVVRMEDNDTVTVRRYWRDGMISVSDDDLREKMRKAALKDVVPTDRKKATDAFDIGFRTAFPKAATSG